MRPNLGIYAQDQWTVSKLTLNLGVRFDHLHARVPSETSAAGRFVPERAFGVVDNVPNWKDVEPRLGAVYDLFGNGKTAIKGSIGRYVISEAVTLAAANNPASSMVTSATRTWTDPTAILAGRLFKFGVQLDFQSERSLVVAPR